MKVIWTPEVQQDRAEICDSIVVGNPHAQAGRPCCSSRKY